MMRIYWVWTKKIKKINRNTQQCCSMEDVKEAKLFFGLSPPQNAVIPHLIFL